LLPSLQGGFADVCNSEIADRRVNEALESTSGDPTRGSAVKPGLHADAYRRGSADDAEADRVVLGTLGAGRRFDFVTEYATKLPAMTITAPVEHEPTNCSAHRR
jgi:hypothetical protein